MNVERFVRQLKLTAEQQGQLAFFVGAGCSISSGIPGAAALVKEWLPKLHYQMTGGKAPFDDWVAAELQNYTSKTRRLPTRPSCAGSFHSRRSDSGRSRDLPWVKIRRSAMPSWLV